MSSRWYYQMLMEEFGPVTVEQLRELFNDGTLGDGDLVRSEADDVWTPLAAMKQSLFAGSVDRLEPTMEEIGDLSELAFEFEDSGPTARRGAYRQESTNESIKESPPVSKAPVSRTVVQNPSPVAAVPVPPVASPRVQTPQPPANDRPVDEWFCESLGQVMGPMSFDELIDLGESGALDANDRVRCGERGIWKTVDCLPRVMRAVAVGTAIHVDPAVVSATTSKRHGDAAVAAMANPTDVPIEPMAEEPPLVPQHPEPPVAVPEKSTPARPSRKSRKNAKGEEELLDEIFDDVFNDASPPAKTTRPVPAMTPSSATAATVSSMNTSPPPMRPPIPPAPAYSSPASQDSSHAAGARLAAAAMASRSSKKSSGSSFEANPATIGILVAVMLVAAGGWYVWQFGIPGGSGNGNGTFDREGSVTVLKAAMTRYKAMGDSPSEAEWKEFSDKTSAEMSAMFKAVYDQAGATPNGAACLGATMCMMKIAKTQPDNKDFIDKNLVEFERQIALVTK